MLSLHLEPFPNLAAQQTTLTRVARKAMKWSRMWLLIATAAFCTSLSVSCGAASWATFQVDDSLSQVLEPSAQLRWRNPIPNRATSNILDATMNVRIVLNTSPWIGKPARIYMLMPPQPQSSLSVQWTTSGLLLPGRLSGGQRQLVFQGAVSGPRIEDWMHVSVTTDARDQVTAPRTNFTFEIEVFR